MTKKQANLLRFVFGVLTALFVGVDSARAHRGPGMTYLLPVAILLLVVSDLIGYLSDNA